MILSDEFLVYGSYCYPCIIIYVSVEMRSSSARYPSHVNIGSNVISVDCWVCEYFVLNFYYMQNRVFQQGKLIALVLHVLQLVFHIFHLLCKNPVHSFLKHIQGIHENVIYF